MCWRISLCICWYLVESILLRCPHSHTKAMTLQANQIPRGVISQILGHSDISTTATYLDSFGSAVIDQAATVL